jgi:hypothetical protein
MTDGPAIDCGVGVGLGFVRPDCAKEGTAKHAKHTNNRDEKRYFIPRTVGLPNPLKICLDNDQLYAGEEKYRRQHTPER